MTGTRVLVCTDLDRTLIRSRRSAGAVDLDALCCVEHRDGVATSVLTPTAARELRALDTVATWVPTTTRTPAQYRRLALPRGPRTGPDLAVCAHGGVLLVDGVPDPGWGARVRALLSGCASPPEVATLLAGPDVGPVRVADDLFVHATVDRPPLPPERVAALDASCRAVGWRAVTSGRKVYALPAGLAKGPVVTELVRRTGAEVVLAAGDSPLDVDLLEAADAAVCPGDAELLATGPRTAGLTVVEGAGVLASERVATWLRTTASRPG